MALHSSLTDPDIHEPKGVSTAADGEVYKADGAGSGTWEPVLPTQTGNSGKQIVTDGTSESWSGDSSVRARGTVTISGTTPTLQAGSVNVASVVRNTTGEYTVTFTTALASNRIQVSINGGHGTYTAVIASAPTANRSTTAFKIFTTVHAVGTVDPSYLDFVVYGGW
jgi:hypothetical protein